MRILVRRFRRTPDFDKPVKVVDFFCGCGGTSAGLRAAGMEIALGLDNDRDAAQSFQANFPEAAFLSVDIQHLTTESLVPVVSRLEGHPLLFSACAPCQPFSQQRRGPASSDDVRFGLLSHLLRFVERFRPEFLFVENVPGLRKVCVGDSAFEPFVRALHMYGYQTEHAVVRSQDYGVPQRRARLMLLGSYVGAITFPSNSKGPKSGSAEPATVNDWIGDLPAISAGETHPHVPNHRAAKLSPLNLERIRATPQGGGWPDLPAELVPKCHQSGSKCYSDVYGRLRWDSPAPALTTRCISYSNGRYGHPEQDRAISVREAASLQTFPMDYVFLGSLNSQARQIGNAVPKLLSQRFGESLMKLIEGSTFPPKQSSSSGKAALSTGLGSK